MTIATSYWLLTVTLNEMEKRILNLGSQVPLSVRGHASCCHLSSHLGRVPFWRLQGGRFFFGKSLSFFLSFFVSFFLSFFLSFKSLLWRFPFSKMQRCRIRSNDQGCLVFQNVHKEKLCYSLDIVAIVKMEKNMLFSWHYYGNRQNGKIVLFSRHCGNRQSTRVPSGRRNNGGCRGRPKRMSTSMDVVHYSCMGRKNIMF